jgi:hypothetical protein
VPRAGKLGCPSEPQPPELGRNGRAIWPVAHDHGCKRPAPEGAQRANEREWILRLLEAADAHDPRRP